MMKNGFGSKARRLQKILWRSHEAITTEGMSDSEYRDYLLRKERSYRRRRSRKANDWNSPKWNPERNLDVVDQKTYTAGEFAQNPSIVLVDPTILQKLLAEPKLLFSLTPRQFEEFIAELLSGLGFHVQLGPLGRDGGVDVFAEREGGIGNELVLVQCKRYRPDHKVGEPIIKQLHADIRDRDATRGLVATTSYFTTTALEYIDRYRYRLSGADYDHLLAWIQKLTKH